MATALNKLQEELAELRHRTDALAGLGPRLKTVEGGLADVGRQVQHLEQTVDAAVAGIRAAVTAQTHTSEKNQELLQQVLGVVRGQTEKGLETPGLANRLIELEARDKAKDAKILAHDQFQFKVLSVVGLLTTALGVAAWKYAPVLIQLLTLLK